MLLTYRHCDGADADYLLALRKQTMVPHLEAAGHQLSDEEHMERVLYKFDGTKLILLNGAIAGMIKTEETPDYFEIIQLQVAPAYQGNGIGRNVMRHFIENAERKNCKIKLSVLKVNPAQNLYRELGFVIIAEEEDSYMMEYRRQ